MSAVQRALPFLFAAGSMLLAQLPQAAQTDLYFPHLADGGPSGAQWQTRFTFINPNTSPANLTLNLYSNSGGPLALNFGSGSGTSQASLSLVGPLALNGPTSQASFTIPPNGTVILQSQGSGSATNTGWAYAGANLPILGNVAFRLLQNGAAKLEITAEPTLPSTIYRAVATPQVGVAVANVYSTPITVIATVYGGVGQVLGQGTLPIPANGHASFNLSQVPNVPANFTGNVAIMAQTTGQVFAAWAVYSDTSGVISSLPDGRAAFPQSQPDQVINAFNRLVVAYETLLPDFGAAPQLVISPEDDANAINAHASNGNTVQINLALAELISDSPSELAFVIAHELGHIYQQRTTKLGWSQNIEWDADEWGLLMELLAGYDPYAGAGALGKLAMATATAGLQAQLMQNWEQLSGVDAHASFGTRIDNLTTFVEAICGYSPNAQSLCAQYKTLVHPHFPALPSVPLIRKNPTKVNGPSPE